MQVLTGCGHTVHEDLPEKVKITHHYYHLLIIIIYRCLKLLLDLWFDTKWQLPKKGFNGVLNPNYKKHCLTALSYNYRPFAPSC